MGFAVGAGLALVVCSNPRVKKAFDRKFNGGSVDELINTIDSTEVRASSISTLVSTYGVSEAVAAALWDAIIRKVRSNPDSAFEGLDIQAANYHPPTGKAAHALDTLKRYQA